MSNRILACLAVSIGSTLAACTDRQQVPSEPQFASTLPVSNACNFNVLNSLISGVFDPPKRGDIQNLKQAMEDAGAQSDTARARGYDIMVEIGKASRSTDPPTPSDGRDLTVGLIRCMFNATNTAEFPSFPNPTIYNFSAALSAGGGYWVRGGATDSTGPVVALSGSSIASGIAPPAPPTTPVAYQWRNTAPNTAPRNGILDERVLIYGYPVDEQGGYDWSQIRPLAIENPGAVVALCAVDASLFTMIQESNAGALAFDSATAASICSATPPVSFLEQEHGPFALVSRLARLGADLLAPAPLHATTLVTSIIGGSRTGRSKFTKLDVTSVTSTWFLAPPSRVKVRTPFTVKIQATTKDANNNSIPALGVCYTVIGGANNGTPTTPQLTGTHNCGQGTAPSSATTMEGGKAIATLVVTATQTGTLIISASGVVLGRSGKVGSLTARTNVNP